MPRVGAHPLAALAAWVHCGLPRRVSSITKVPRSVWALSVPRLAARSLRCARWPRHVERHSGLSHTATPIIHCADDRSAQSAGRALLRRDLGVLSANEPRHVGRYSASVVCAIPLLVSLPRKGCRVCGGRVSLTSVDRTPHEMGGLPPIPALVSTFTMRASES